MKALFYLIMASTVLAGCQTKPPAAKDRTLPEILSELMVCDLSDSSSIFLEFGRGISDSRDMLILIEAKAEPASEQWTCEGNVCHPEEALAKYGEIVRKYGNAGIQIKVLHSDDGCRTVYHRETSLLP